MYTQSSILKVALYNICVAASVSEWVSEWALLMHFILDIYHITCAYSNGNTCHSYLAVYTLSLFYLLNFQGKEEEFTRAHQPRREAMSKEAPVSIARVLAAKDDLLLVEKTSGESVRKQTQSSLNKVLIGKVCATDEPLG